MARHCIFHKTLLRTYGMRTWPSLNQTCGLNSSDLNLVDYAIWRPCRSKFVMAGSSTLLISWSRWLCWSGLHCRSASLIIASVNRDYVCSVLWMRIADTLNRHFTDCLYCKIIVVTDVLKFFWSASWLLFANYQPESGALIHMASSIVLCFR